MLKTEIIERKSKLNWYLNDVSEDELGDEKISKEPFCKIFKYIISLLRWFKDSDSFSYIDKISANEIIEEISNY